LEVSGKAAADFVQYFGGTDRSLTNLYFPLVVRYTTERETFGFDGGFTRDNTLMGELKQTGVVLAFTQRNLWNLAPSWTHALTERVSLQAGYQYTNATYENGAQLGLVDYTVQAASGGILYQSSEVLQTRLSGSYTNFNAPQGGNIRSQIYAAKLSFTYNFSESITASAEGGPSFVQSAVGPASARMYANQTVFVASGTLRKSWIDAALQLEAAREINPSGFGFLLQTDRVGMTFSKDFSEQWAASLNGSVLFSSGITSEAVPVTFPTNRFIYVTPQVTWKFSQWWNLAVSYTYANRHVESLNQTGFANVASVMLTYFPPKWTVGR
jgi:hypothetical protein